MSALTSVSVVKYRDIDEQQLTVGATEVAFPSPRSGFGNAVENIFVQASTANTGTVTIGSTNQSSLTSLGAGIILSAGQNINLPLAQWVRWKAIASAASQKINIIYCKEAI